MKLISVLRGNLFLHCLIFILSSHIASAQGFVWAQGIVSSGSGGNTGVEAITTDANNNGYFIGNITGTADVDPGPGVQNLTAVSDMDMYILKKDAAGNFLWAKQVAGINSGSTFCFGKDISLDSFGNIYIAGFFQDSFDFDPGPGVYKLLSYGGNHSFVLKLDPAGNFIWVKDMGSQTTVAAMQILRMQMDAAANIYFCCNAGGMVTPGNVDVDPGPGVHNVLFPGSGSSDILIEKLDSAGNFIWVKQISGNNFKASYGLTLDTMSNVHITGKFRGTADFDPGPGTANLTAPSTDFDAFVAKYDSAGNYQWAKQISGGGEQLGFGIATDTFGNIVVTGNFATGTIDFDPGPGVYNVTATSMDMFTLKLRSDGSFGWASSVHPAGNDRGDAITTDGQGNVYTSGDLFTSADFDPGPGEYWLGGGVYVQKLDSIGNFLWARVFAGQVPSAIVLDQASDIYVVGQIIGGGDFDPGPGVFNLPGGNAGFIEKLCGASLAITASDSTPCPGDNVQLSTPAITGATYTWTLDGTVIPGSTNTITVSQPGVYEVYVDGGCPSASGPLYIIDCTGVG